MSNEEVIQEVKKDVLANGKYPNTLFVCGTQRTERLSLWVNYQEGDMTLHETGLAGLNLAWSIGVKDKKPIGDIERLFYVEHGSIGKKPDDIETIRIDCLEMKEKKPSISVLQVVRGKRNKLEDLVPYMMPTKDGKKVPLISKVPSEPNQLLEAFMHGYSYGCELFRKP